MKKTYIQPSMKAYVIKIDNVLFTSVQERTCTVDNDQNQFGKKNGYVDDDWEDEE